MKTSTILLTTLLTLSSATSFANVDKDFKVCAQKALDQKQLHAKSIKVDLSSKSAIALDHSHTKNLREYRMHLGTASGKKLGSVACTFNQQGQIESISYLNL